MQDTFKSHICGICENRHAGEGEKRFKQICTMKETEAERVADDKWEMLNA